MSLFVDRETTRYKVASMFVGNKASLVLWSASLLPYHLNFPAQVQTLISTTLLLVGALGMATQSVLRTPSRGPTFRDLVLSRFLLIGTIGASSTLLLPVFFTLGVLQGLFIVLTLAFLAFALHARKPILASRTYPNTPWISYLTDDEVRVTYPWAFSKDGKRKKGFEFLR